MNTAIAIFCKTPDLTPVKTRLASDIGRRNANQFYKLSILAVEEVIKHVKEKNHSVDAYWAVAENAAITNTMWNSFPCVWTGEGGLGERIYHIFEFLLPKYEQVIIIGSDSPQISYDYILEAIEKLSHNNIDGVIGPCKDGGFVLFGCKTLINQSVWTDAIYSREDTLEQIMNILEKTGYQYDQMPKLGDVDTINDLSLLMQELENLGAKMESEQKNLLFWLNDIFMKISMDTKCNKPDL